MTRSILAAGFLVALGVLPVRSALAQNAGSCGPGTAQATLSAGTVRASLFNTGRLFYGGTTPQGEGYAVGHGLYPSPLYAASLWLAGTVSGETRVAGTQYGGRHFFPGPLPDATRPPTDCAAYDRIYVVTRDDVRRYLRTGETTPGLADWPVALGAPVLDGDGVAGNYNLAGGDQPALRGGAAGWWVMNDAGNVHAFAVTAPTSAPLGVEVRVEAVGFETAPFLQQTVYQYTFVNRSPTRIDSLYAGMWVDADVGFPSDDYVATDTTLGMAFTYDAGPAESGDYSRAVGVLVLGGPLALANRRDDDRDGAVDEPGERLGLTAAPMILKHGPVSTTGEPTTPSAYAARLRGLLADGTVMREDE